jgi:hypothetical protein
VSSGQVKRARELAIREMTTPTGPLTFAYAWELIAAVEAEALERAADDFDGQKTEFAAMWLRRRATSIRGKNF